MYCTMLFVLYFGSKTIITTNGTALDIGQFSTLLTYSFQILTSLMMLSMIFVMITFSEESALRICEVLKDIDAIKIVGGGDSVSFVNNNGYDSIFTHISTGGGATLELLEGKDLPGIRAIK